MRVNPLINDSMKSVEFNSNAFFDSTQLKDATDRKLYNVDHFCIPPFTIDFVEKELDNLNTTKTTGADNIHAKFLKMSSSTIAPLLTYIHVFNCSGKQQIFPIAFKLAKGEKSNKNNYRPISVLPVLSLIFEKHVNLYLKSYLESNKLLYSRQSGFRSNNSCQTALIKNIDGWLSAIDKNEIVGYCVHRSF